MDARPVLDYAALAKTKAASPIPAVPMKEVSPQIFESTMPLYGEFEHVGMPWTYKIVLSDGNASMHALAGGIGAFFYDRIPDRLEVTDGDVLEVNGKLFQIRDNYTLHDPFLMAIDKP